MLWAALAFPGCLPQSRPWRWIVSHALARIPVLIAGAALEGIAGTVGWLGGLRVADLCVPAPRTTLILLRAMCVVLAMALCAPPSLAGCRWIGRVGRKCALDCCGPAASADWFRVLEMTAIDVGQGDSILLVSPSGRTLLVDAGGLPHWAHSDLDIGEDVISIPVVARHQPH